MAPLIVSRLDLAVQREREALFSAEHAAIYTAGAAMGGWKLCAIMATVETAWWLLRVWFTRHCRNQHRA